MADFSSLSSPGSDDSAVESLISQAIDLSALQQIAALNSSLASDSVLPTHLETRFHKLKSFPGAHPKPTNPHRRLDPEKKEKPKSPNQNLKKPTSSLDEEADSYFSDEPVKSEVPSQFSPLKSSNASRKYPDSSPDKENENSIPAKDHTPKSRSGSLSSPTISSNSSMKASSSPPQQTRCFWCSPKKASRKKSKSERVVGLDHLDLSNRYWGQDDDILSNLSSLSLKDQQRRMKKILKEEEEMVNREAEKVLKWVKQASARFE